jgi:hypothetical protein
MDDNFSSAELPNVLEINSVGLSVLACDGIAVRARQRGATTLHIAPVLGHHSLRQVRTYFEVTEFVWLGKARP